MIGGRLLAQTSDDGENSKALSMKPDLTGYTSYQWRNNAASNYTVGNFVWNENPFDTYVDIMEHIKITLDPNYQGGVFGRAIVGRDGKLTEVLPTLIRDGYTFNGWFTEAESGTAVTTENVFNENTTIYAHWTVNQYNVILNENGGTIQTGNVTGYTYGEGATLPTDVTKTGYTFEGWYDNEALTGNPVTEISNTAIGNKEYWAKWKVKSTIDNIPQTGDNSHMALWIVLLFVSGGLLIATGVYGKKIKRSAR